MCMHVCDGLTACPVNCESCLNSDTCTRCMSGHYLLHGQCNTICPEEFEPSEQSMECIPKGECHQTYHPGLSGTKCASMCFTIRKLENILFPVLFFLQCTVRWESGVSGGHVCGQGNPALEKKAEHGKFCSPPVLRATPALPPQRRDNARKRDAVSFN